MYKLRAVITTLAIILALFANTLTGKSALQAAKETVQPTLATPAEIQSELCTVPSDNRERETAMAKLFIQAGATEEEVHRQAIAQTPTPAANVYVSKSGRTDNVIVVGAHIDHVSVGQGVIDDWSGATLVANIYQALRSLQTNHTIVFIGFASEERGLIGSRAYVAALSTTEKARHKAMFNLECLGVGEAHIWENGSDQRLAELLHSVATREKIPLHNHILHGVSADSNPFRAEQIPALTMDGLPQEQFSYIHSEKDTCANVNQAYYYDAYRLAVRYVLELDRSLAETKIETGIEMGRDDKTE
ncbi:MAG: M28 family peptidase [Acidobacteriota bacterium]